MPKKVCLVTAEFHGLFKNGGIGTANTGLALELAEAGHEVTVAYVDPAAAATLATNEAFLAQRARWRERGIFLDFIPRWSRLKTSVDDICWSLSVLEYLRPRRFDVALFNECGGQAYYAMLAKRAGLFADAPRMIVVTHGPSDWARELNAQLPVGYRSAALAFFERRSVELADLAVSPSRYLTGWMRARGWKLPRDVETLQNIVPAPPAETTGEAARKIDEIVFFGRLESRKGLEIFCDAVEELDRAGRLGEAAVTFLGKFSRVGGVHSGVFILESTRGWKVAPRILADLGQAEAIEYLKRPGVLAVIPSLAENSPCVVAECLIAGVPFVATDSGGTAELVAEGDRDGSLVAPIAAALAAKLSNILSEGQSPARLAEPQSGTRERWRAIVERSQPSALPAESGGARPRVSICLVHPAGAEPADSTLELVRGQTHRDIETIVVAYGAATDGRATAEPGAPRELRFERRSPDRAAAGNFAAQNASGDWLMFVHERDLLLEPNAVEALLGAAGRLGVEAISGFAFAFGRPGRPNPEWDGEIGVAPIGPAREIAAFENCLGDEVFLISRRAFDAIGGYESDVDVAIENRLLLTRALVAGVALDLAPAPLAWSRAGERGDDDKVANMRRILEAFHDLPLRDFSHVMETVLSQGPQQIRARAMAWLASIEEPAKELALRLTFNFVAGAPDSFPSFVRYCVARGRLVEALDFARMHDPDALLPIAEAGAAREAERVARASLREQALGREISFSLNPTVIERLRLVSAPPGVSIDRDAQCVAAFRLRPGLTVAKAPLACPGGVAALAARLEFTASGDLSAEIALAAAEPLAQAELTEDTLRSREGFWWSGWRRAEPAGFELALAGLPADRRALDLFLLSRSRLTARGDSWVVWRSLTAKGPLSAMTTPSGVIETEAHYPLPLHWLEKGELVTDASDFPFAVFSPGDPTLHHPLAGRPSVVRIRGAVPQGAIGVRASFSVENAQAHPIAFAMWVRASEAPASDEPSLANSAAASGWTLCPKPFMPDIAEARLSAPAPKAMDLYLATKVVGFDDVGWCHAYWREILILERLRS